MRDTERIGRRRGILISYLDLTLFYSLAVGDLGTRLGVYGRGKEKEREL